MLAVELLERVLQLRLRGRIQPLGQQREQLAAFQRVVRALKLDQRLSARDRSSRRSTGRFFTSPARMQSPS